MTAPFDVLDRTAEEPNFWVGRSGYRVLAFVEHVMQGTLVGTDAWFEKKSSDVSAHYGIGKLVGTPAAPQVHKYVDIRNTAWHAGVVDQPTAPFVLRYPDVNPNYLTVGVEHEGYSGDPFGEDQYAATLWVHQQVLLEGPPVVAITAVTADELIPHHAINALHAGCPGPTFPLARLLADLQAWTTAGRPAP